MIDKKAIEEFQRVVLEHVGSYPHIGVWDVIKLAYQNEFGGGHLVGDSARSLAYLKREYSEIKRCDMLKIEDIGNGLCRVYLNGLDERLLERLNEIFVESASRVCGSVGSFVQKLNAVVPLADDGRMPFTGQEFLTAMKEYEAIGYPAIHHSDAYRNEYAPSYRVVLASLVTDLR